MELREETFQQVTNLLTYPRLLQELQLKTFKVVGHHDANAQTGDLVQWGWLRLPTRSYFLAFLAVCGVTHYVYIPLDLGRVEIVGPAHAIATLVDLSNAAATTRLTAAQLVTLRDAFGMGDTWTKADKVCTLWERRAACFMGVSYMGLWCILKPSLAAGTIVSLSVILSALVIGLGLIIAASAWRLAHTGDGQEVRHHDGHESDDSAEPLVPVPLPEPESQTASDVPIPTVVHVDAYAVTVTAMQPSIYSTLAARNYYYEVVKQQTVQSIPDEVIVHFKEEAQMYAVQVRPGFQHYLAERTTIPEGASLHILIHNPTIDPYLTNLYGNFQKGVGL